MITFIITLIVATAIATAAERASKYIGMDEMIHEMNVGAQKLRSES